MIQLSKSCPAVSSCRSRKPPHAGALPCIGRPVLCSRTARGQRRKGDVPRRFALTILEEVRAAGRHLGIGRFPPRRSLPGRQPRRGTTGTRRSLPTATHKNRKRPDPRAKTPGQRALLDTGPWGQLCRYLKYPLVYHISILKSSKKEAEIRFFSKIIRRRGVGRVPGSSCLGTCSDQPGCSEQPGWFGEWHDTPCRE